MAKPIYGELAAYAVIALLSLLIMVGIIWLAKNMPCSQRPINSFEHFVDATCATAIREDRARRAATARLEGTPGAVDKPQPQQPPVEDRILPPPDKVTLKQMEDYYNKLRLYNYWTPMIQPEIEKRVAAYNTATNDVCAIVMQIEEQYVGNASAPPDDFDTSLPEDAQKRILDARKVNAKKQWISEKSTYARANNAPLYECFATQTEQERTEQANRELRKYWIPFETIRADENKLNIEIKKARDYLNAPEVIAITSKAPRLRNLIGFNNKWIKQLLDSMSAAQGAKEGFETILRGEPLLTAVEDLFKEVRQTLNDMDAVINETAKQKKAVGAINGKTNKLRSGEYTKKDLEM